MMMCVYVYVGTQNLSGQCVFDCVPAEGLIPAGGAREILVTFAPDHPSDYYSDGCRIELFGQVTNTCFIFGQVTNTCFIFGQVTNTCFISQKDLPYWLKGLS